MASTEERFSMALHNTTRIWRQALDRRLKDLGVSQAGWMAIANIAKAREALSQIELANRLNVEGPTVVSLVDRLVKADLVERVPSETDRRIKHVVLTEAGQAIYAKVKAVADAYRRQVFAGIDKERLLAATEILEALQAQVEASL
ncbi:MarR family winged helix-turn-helix transcriptional regulator [Roseateles saccharophilus]|uniref:MarR family transcriptional regulator for hemolysin n=1 Tax=Roseateles saccharophilus TaxID=304 RepID=A0A4R3VA75_ROSSA|nr:MarR family transcriptional regulator [Roseateles saccharophilus]MDG0834995.1 MarR family transcriptional regulator [Roseateles saccharophilus]TCV00418.1 MarR family transcriptional regulator for hemolysin [Roseateles saccharophilus]